MLQDSRETKQQTPRERPSARWRREGKGKTKKKKKKNVSSVGEWDSLVGRGGDEEYGTPNPVYG